MTTQNVDTELSAKDWFRSKLIRSASSSSSSPVSPVEDSPARSGGNGIDIASIMVGVIVILVLVGVAVATVTQVIPYLQGSGVTP